MLNCQSFEERLHGLLDQRESLQDDESLSRHAVHCTHCQQTLDAYDKLFDGLEFWEPPPLHNEFAQRVVQQVCVDRAGPPPRHRSLFYALIAASVVLALIPLSRYVLNRRPVDQAQAEVLVADAPTRRVPLESDLLVASRTGDFLDPALVLQEPWRSIFNQITSEMALDPEGLESMEQFADGLEPLRVSLNAAFHTLRRTIPIGRPYRQNAPVGAESASNGMLMLVHV